MISLAHISYEVAGKEIIHNVSFAINDGEKIGLIGPNGVGKTTLLKLISGDISPTSGKINKTKREIGVLPQDLREWLDYSVYEFIETITGVKATREQFEAQCTRLERNSSEQALSLYADAVANAPKCFLRQLRQLPPDYLY